MRRFIFVIMAALAIITPVSASEAVLVLPDIISSNMVLQQQTNVRLWGKATPGAVVSVKGDWTSEGVTAKAAADSTWHVWLPTPPASMKPQTLTFTIGQQTLITLNDVLIGEVWFCSGQSNMQMPLNGFDNCPIRDGNEEIALAAQWASCIRMATVPTRGSDRPQEWASNCKWQKPSYTTAPQMSASAWYFAKMLTQVLNVPVGIIACAWGGSSVEGWTPREILETYADFDLQLELERGYEDGRWRWYAPMVMYNGLLHPLRHYTVKGFLWYQGEANVGKHATYAQRMKNMVEQWRNDFDGPPAELPFYQAEIAPWAGYGGADGESGALLREAQHAATRIIDNCYCIVTNDLVEPYESSQIHPANKRDVGYRFAYSVLHHTYGCHQIAGDSPEYDHMVINGSEIEVFFRHAEGGLSPRRDIHGFEVSGADGVFHPAMATVNEQHKSVVVSSTEVAEPVAVRYCFQNFLPGNLINHRGLPAVPFRTDQFPQRK
ncbi:MAG: sialate O-acetylesterase [Prevotella sp.]|nr:sialate O-acetylesterase [Prevotella sp.]